MTDVNDYRLRVLPPTEVNLSWPKIAELLEPAIEFCNGEFEVSDLLSMVTSGRAFVLGLEDQGDMKLAAVCEVIELPRKRVLNVIALGGSKLDVMLIFFWHQIQNIGRILGVNAVRGSVRPAMQRYCRRISPDALVAYTVMERKL